MSLPYIPPNSPYKKEKGYDTQNLYRESKKKTKKKTLFQVMNTNCHISNIKNVTLRKAQ